MRAIRLEKPEHFAAVEVDEPDKPGAGEALVEVHRVGICGTDVSGYLGKMPFFTYPVIPGHELGVQVMEVGEGVGSVREGDHCSIEPYMNCGDCYACRKGATNCCESLEVIGVHKDGGMCERFILPARKLHPSTKMTMEQLALVETLAIGCNCVNRSDTRQGDKVLVIGAGPIGMAAIEFLKVAKAEITVMDMNETRLEFCKEKLGVDHTVVFKNDNTEVDRLREVNGGDLPVTVIDATGSHISMSSAFQYVSFTGQVLYVGITTQELNFKHVSIHRPELTIKASRNAVPADFSRIISLIEDGVIDTDPWLSHQASYEDFIGEFTNWLKPETGVIKAVLHMN
ncbi:MAG: zinc-binding alcohol dehydrogenase family protein [Verrucomicrobiota bacterium]|jgi:alcohol dehydrogenase|nr:zinc-binding alcohol dehydrogenase family protein [Verrucomicrobiota bacterium]